MNTTADTLSLYIALRAVPMTGIPTMSSFSDIPPEAQASNARALFERFGLKGLVVACHPSSPSIRARVSVKVPMMPAAEHQLELTPHSPSYEDEPTAECSACAGHARAKRDVLEILARAFPRLDWRTAWEVW